MAKFDNDPTTWVDDFVYLLNNLTGPTLLLGSLVFVALGRVPFEDIQPFFYTGAGSSAPGMIKSFAAKQSSERPLGVPKIR